ncbi:hypothetical protein L7F22_031772 [Adiantum nelumboides]|nr:hypothetical protein [Adiantum nelumboides]
MATDRSSGAMEATVKAKSDSKASRREVKVPKGTRDFDPLQMAIREKVFGIVTGVFKRHGGVALDTPVFELKETLMGKYGEDSKLIYDLADQGGELSSLRYDLTVPFARYLATKKLNGMRRYHIAKVYRRDNPARGRYREFYQCDFDIAGTYDLMVPDFEVLKVLTEILDKLDIGDYEVKLNHRRLLDGMLEICGVPAEKFRTICSAIDKLDKLTWDDVRKEMVHDKGLTEEVADKIGNLVKRKGRPMELLDELMKEDSPFRGNAASEQALAELKQLFTYMDMGKCLNRFVFDLSLARGLDYYTGVIFEAVFIGTVKMGSIAAGGRYDDLVGMFSGSKVPSVGMSLGIERVFAIMEEQASQLSVRKTQTQVLVIGIGKTLWNMAIGIATELWHLEIATEFRCVAPGKIKKQLSEASEKEGIPWVVLVGQDELNMGIVKVKNMAENHEEEVRRDKLAAELQAKISGVNLS